MTALNRSTRRRLLQLRQVPSVWEGDRRVLAPDTALSRESGTRGQGECIIWVDASEGLVRAMDVVTEDTGPEAIVRTLAASNGISPQLHGCPLVLKKLSFAIEKFSFFYGEHYKI